MEGKKQPGSSSSITNELFGTKESSSSAIYTSIFAPSKKVSGQSVVDSMGKKQECSKDSLNSKLGGFGDATKPESKGDENKDMSSLYQDQRAQPCHLSSSIFYGGQDDYSQFQSSKGSSINDRLSKDGADDDSGCASRGNWWQGSLYY